MENELVNQPNKTLEKILITIIKWGVYLSLLTPLIVVSDSFYSFVVPKTIYFRVIVEIIFATYLILILSFPKYRPKINALSISIFIFILISIITSVLGVDFQRSFWSVYERMTGLFTILHLYAFFIVLSNIFRERKDWERLFFISIAIGVICCLGVVAAESISRGGGTIGNTSFLASYLLFNIFFAIALLIKNKFSGLGIFATISLLIFIPILLSASARGATISFFGGLFLLFMSLLFFSGKKKLKAIVVTTSLVLILISGILIFSFPTIKNIVVSHLNDMKARVLVWEMAWKGFLERPILGWGLENFDIVFAKFFNPKLFLGEYGEETWFDRAHNIVLDTLINSGIVGLISYLSIFFISIFSLLKKCFVESKEQIGINLVIISLLIAYFAQNLLVFDLISSYILFFLTLAFINFLIQKTDFEESSDFIVNGFFKKICYVLIFMSTSVCFYFGNIQPANSAISITKMIITDDLEEKTEFYKKSLNTLKHNNEINHQFGLSLLKKIDSYSKDQDFLKDAFDLAKKETEKNVERNSLNLRARLSLAKLYLAEYKLMKDEQVLFLAEKVLLEAVKNSPENQKCYWLLADLSFERGDFEESIRFFQKAINLEPQLDISRWYLISYYNLIGQYENALKEAENAESVGLDWRTNASFFQEVIIAHEGLEEYEIVIPLYKRLLSFYPNNDYLWFKFSLALFNSGDKESAKEAAQEAVRLNPLLINQVGEVLKMILQ